MGEKVYGVFSRVNNSRRLKVCICGTLFVKIKLAKCQERVMKNLKYIAFPIIILILFIGTVQAQDSSDVKPKPAQPEHGPNFVDKDGDGYNDNAPDHDGDGIPNGLDPDWQKMKKGKGKGKHRRFIDLDGDGINDNLQTDETEQQAEQLMIRNQKGEVKGGSMDQNKETGKGQKGKQKGKR